MGTISMSKPQLLAFDGNPITDHNRSPLVTDVERIGTKHRMANAKLRSYFVADKRTFGVSWTDVPHSADFTVDGFWAADEISNFYNQTPGEFELTITHDNGDEETAIVMFGSFSKTLSKRGTYNFYEMNVEMEEA